MKIKLFLLSTAMLYLNGCATMTQSECLNANWRIIGIEDGADGQLSSYLGEHRKACAPYNVIPDLNAYLDGHRAGVQQYCTPQNAYNVGERGKKYQGVCPPELEGAFLEAYSHGYGYYSLNRELDSVESSIRYKADKIDELHKEIAEFEKQLISDQTYEAQRKQLLENIKECQRQIAYLEKEIYDLGAEEIILKERIEAHNRHYRY